MNYRREFKNKLLKIWGREPQDMGELAECVIAVLNRQPSDSWKPRSKPVRVVGFSWRLTHTAQVSNSHDCPIDGVTNWCGRASVLAVILSGLAGSCLGSLCWQM